MFTKIYWINEPKIGERRLGIMARPRGKDWLDDEVKGLKMRDVSCLVSLLENSEVIELGLEEEVSICQKWGIEFINFPVEDVNIPNDDNKFIELAKQLVNKINNSEKVVIHCRMGIGRSSVLAAAIMLILECKAENIFERITEYRTLKVPDTQEQKEWLLGLQKQLGQ